VTEERACTICFKRIGTAAFVATQDGSLQHFSCCKRTSQLQLATQPPQTLEGGFPLSDARGAAHRTTSFGTVS
jgi:Vacuolar sorting protein 39 domain 2